MKIELSPGRSITIEGEMTPESLVSALETQAPDELRKLMTQDFLARAKNSGSGRLYRALLDTTRRGGMVTEEGQQAPASAADVAAEMGPLESAAVAAGGTVEGLTTGAQKLFSDDTKDAELESKYEENQRLLEAVEEESPVASFLGGSLPYYAVPVGAPGAAVRLGTRALTRMLPKAGQAVARAGRAVAPRGGTRAAILNEGITGLGIGALDEGSTALEEGLSGAVGSAVLGPMFRGSGTRLRRSEAGREHLERLERLRQAGYSISPAEATRERRSDVLDSLMRRLPLTEVGAELQSNRNQKALRQTIRGATGLPDNTPMRSFKDLREAGDRLTRQYPEAFTNSLEIDDTLRNTLDDIMSRELAEPSAVGEFGTAKPATQWIRVARNQYGDNWSPDGVRQLWTSLNNQISNLMKSGGGATGGSAKLLEEVEDALVDGVRRQHGSDAANRILNARDRYRIGKALQNTRTFARHRATDTRWSENQRALIDPQRLLDSAFPRRRSRMTTGQARGLADELTALEGFRQSVVGPRRNIISSPTTGVLGAGTAIAMDPVLGTTAAGLGALSGLGRFGGLGRGAAMEGPIGGLGDLLGRVGGATDPLRDRTFREQVLPAILARLGVAADVDTE